MQIAAAHLQNPDLVVALTAVQACHSMVSFLLEQAQVRYVKNECCSHLRQKEVLPLEYHGHGLCAAVDCKCATAWATKAETGGGADCCPSVS